MSKMDDIIIDSKVGYFNLLKKSYLSLDDSNENIKAKFGCQGANSATQKGFFDELIKLKIQYNKNYKQITNYSNFTIHLRDYQLEAEKQITYELDNNNKCINILPTGGGKTLIFYKIIYNLITNDIERCLENRKVFYPKVILILLPRIKLCNQTVGDNYVSLIPNCQKIILNSLNKNYEGEFISGISNFKNIIIACTYQSSNKLYKLIKNYHYNIDLAIYDECHGITTWMNENKNTKSDNPDITFLMKSSKIKNRLFTSATPCENQINNKAIYGESVKVTGVNNLIKKGYLVPIKTIIKEDKINDNDLENTTGNNICNFINNTCQKENKRKIVIFCNTKRNCNQIYKYFKSELKTHVFKYITENKNSSINPEKELQNFEKTREQSYLITCKKISMGYDNVEIDCIVFLDPKCSKIEIAQCIGRGLRVDTNNPGKYCTVIIPIIEKELNKSDYKTVFEYLAYLNNEGIYSINSLKKRIKKPKPISNPNPITIPNYGFEYDETLIEKVLDKFCTRFDIPDEKEDEVIFDLGFQHMLNNSNYQNVLLIPIKSKSYSNFKRNIIDNLSTGSYKIEWSLRHTFKDNITEKILSNCKKVGNYITYNKLNQGDIILFIEDNFVTFSFMEKKYFDTTKSQELWYTEDFAYILPVNVLKRHKYEDNIYQKLNEILGFKSNYVFRGPVILNKVAKRNTINQLFDYLDI